MEKLTQLQELIGTDKKNPFFTVCNNSQQPGKLLIYYGMTLLEVVEDNPEHPTFK